MTDRPARLARLRGRDHAQAWLVGVLVMVFLLVLFLANMAAQNRVDTRSKQRDAALTAKVNAQRAAAANGIKAAAGQDLAKQVRAACAHGGLADQLGSICPQASHVATAAAPSPVPVAPGVVALPGPQGVPGVSVTGPPGRTVVGPPGRTVVGPPGPAIVGPPGQNGNDGASVTGPPGESIVGPSGASVTGPPGKDGADGVSVTGPPGPPGADGSSVTGPPGVDGNPGQPPVSWTILFRGKTFTCTRTDPFEPAAPTYRCAQ